MTFLPFRLARAVLAGIGTAYETLIPGPSIHGYRLDAAEVLAEAEEAQEVSEPECNCTAFGDPEFDAEYCSLHNQQTVHVAGLDVTRASLDELGASLQRITDAEQSAFRSANNRLIRDALGPYAAPQSHPAPAAGQRGENPAGVTPPTSAGSPTWADWAVPAICDALVGHRYSVPLRQCECEFDNDAFGPPWDEQDWREHVAPLIAERLDTAWNARARDLAAPLFETGLDMGVSVASEFFPQHQKHQ